TLGGAVVTAGQFGDWHPIGVEQTSTGYEVAWRSGASDANTVWNLDNFGSFQGSPFGVMSGLALALNDFESEFYQDLNGDGTIGMVEVTIEAGATQLVGRGGQFFLLDGNHQGPQLSYGGAAVSEGEFGAWRPIGAEKTASVYDVAWRNGAADQYTM